MTTSVLQPDVEIYVKNTDADMISSWLADTFKDFDATSLAALDLSARKPFTVSIPSQDKPIELMITPHAAGKAYSSLWFKSDQTPWRDDLACAEAFLALHDTEVRCSAASWTEEEAEFSEKWWKLTRDGRELVVWG